MRCSAFVLLALAFFLLIAPIAAAQIDLTVDHEDPRGDVRANGEDVDRPEGDVVHASTKPDGDDIVTTVTAAADIPDNGALQFETYFLEGDFFQNKIIIDIDRADVVEVEGRLAKDFQTADTFNVQVARDGETLTLRWPASAVPEEAECFDFVATLHSPESGADGQDHAGWDITKPSSCAPKSGSSASGTQESPGLAMPLLAVAVAGVAAGIIRRH